MTTPAFPTSLPAFVAHFRRETSLLLHRRIYRLQLAWRDRRRGLSWEPHLGAYPTADRREAVYCAAIRQELKRRAIVARLRGRALREPTLAQLRR